MDSTVHKRQNKCGRRNKLRSTRFFENERKTIPDLPRIDKSEKNMTKKIYISGQITGLPFDEVKAKFEKAESELRAQGYEVVSPLKTGIPYNAPWEVHISVDVILLISCDAVYLLSDWKCSKGATLEKTIAELTGKEIIYQEVTVFAELKQAISEVMGISFYDIVGNSRKRNVVYARMIYAFFCREKGESITDISTEMKHDHSTVIYYLRKFNDDYKFNPKFREIVNRIENNLSKTNF